jgi:hypothetical protein
MAATTTGAHSQAEPAVSPNATALVAAGEGGSTAVEPVAAPAEARRVTLRTMSRMVYVSSYAVAYGIVYAAVFVALSMPRENSVMQGFRDGGQAAVAELSKAERVDGSEPVSKLPAAQPV